MNTFPETVKNYLKNCQEQKRLDAKTLKAYQIDLTQFYSAFKTNNIYDISVTEIEGYIADLHQNYKPKTVKRKIASIKAFYHYLEYQDFIPVNPFNKIRTRFRAPQTLPKTIPLHLITFYDHVSATRYRNNTIPKTKNASRYCRCWDFIFYRNKNFRTMQPKRNRCKSSWWLYSHIRKGLQRTAYTDRKHWCSSIVNEIQKCILSRNRENKPFFCKSKFKSSFRSICKKNVKKICYHSRDWHTYYPSYVSSYFCN